MTEVRFGRLLELIPRDAWPQKTHASRLRLAETWLQVRDWQEVQLEGYLAALDDILEGAV